MGRQVVLQVITAVLLFLPSLAAESGEPSWLDRPLASWTTAERAVPRVAIEPETRSDIIERCKLPLHRNTSGERALADAGWMPFHMFDRQIVERDVEIVGGLAGVDGMCRPSAFNVFVFVGGRLAGTLSPARMSSRTDGSIGGAIRLAGDDIAAEFVRYTDADALCCPSGRVTVRYRIDRTASPPVVVPVSARVTRR